jgi:hypothetical protein
MGNFCLLKNRKVFQKENLLLLWVAENGESGDCWLLTWSLLLWKT